MLFSKGNNLNKQMKISVREFKKEDIELIIDYFINSNAEILKGKLKGILQSLRQYE